MEVQQAHWERTVASGQGPAYRIHTRRLVLRCWQPTDAPLLKAAIDASLEHLRPWMLWAQHEPTDLYRTIEHLRRCRGEFDLGQDFACFVWLFQPGVGFSDQQPPGLGIGSISLPQGKVCADLLPGSIFSV